MYSNYRALSLNRTKPFVFVKVDMVAIVTFYSHKTGHFGEWGQIIFGQAKTNVSVNAGTAFFCDPNQHFNESFVNAYRLRPCFNR